MLPSDIRKKEGNNLLPKIAQGLHNNQFLTFFKTFFKFYFSLIFLSRKQTGKTRNE